MSFIIECKRLLGNRCIDDEQTTLSMSQTTFKTTNAFIAILKPKTSKEVSEIIKLANRFRVSIFTISKGKNFGYGNASPNKDQSILCDLSLMDTIQDYNSKQGYITVEPGVTFFKTFDYLKKQGDEFTISGTGAPPDSSLIGNLSERGIGKGLAANRSDFVCSLEVVLANGEIINTGMGKYQNSKVKNLTRWGAGPQLDGLFIQSNLGIITKATFWLTHKPSHFQTFIYTISEHAKLPDLLNALQRLKQKGIIKSNLAIFNDYRAIAFFDSFPFDKHNPNDGHLPREILAKQLKSVLGKSALWFGDGALFDYSNAQSSANRDLIKKELSPFVDNLIFFNKRNVQIFKAFAKLSKFFKKFEALEKLISVFYESSAYLGNPTHISLRSTYWRKKSVPEEIRPIEDNCGVYWIGAMAPFDGDDISQAVKLIEDTITSYGFEPAVTLQAVTERQVDLIISITFDRDIKESEDRAKECHDKLFIKLLNDGYYPYRLGLQSHHLMPKSTDYSLELIKKIKYTLDPQDTLAPGRYDFREHWTPKLKKKAS